MKIVPFAEEARDHLRRVDPRLSAVIDRVGPCDLRIHDCKPYESLVRAIVYQQLSGKAAATIFGRVVAACDRDISPSKLAALDDATLRSAGLSSQKVRYVRDLTERATDGSLTLQKMGRLSDEEIINLLIQVKGIGVWSAQMFLMFALGRPDVLPFGDLGIQKGAMKIYKLKKMPDEAKLTKIAKPWQPYRTAGCWYLWRSLEVDGKIGE